MFGTQLSGSFIALILTTSISICSGAAKQTEVLSHQFAGAGEIHAASVDEFLKTTVPTYVMNSAQYEGTTADLAKSNTYGPSDESDMLANWATASGPFEVEQFVKGNNVHVLNTNPCSPQKWCSHYSIGYVFSTP